MWVFSWYRCDTYNRLISKICAEFLKIQSHSTSCELTQIKVVKWLNIILLDDINNGITRVFTQVQILSVGPQS